MNWGISGPVLSLRTSLVHLPGSAWCGAPPSAGGGWVSIPAGAWPTFSHLPEHCGVVVGQEVSLLSCSGSLSGRSHSWGSAGVGMLLLLLTGDHRTVWRPVSGPTRFWGRTLDRHSTQCPVVAPFVFIFPVVFVPQAPISSCDLWRRTKYACFFGGRAQVAIFVWLAPSGSLMEFERKKRENP